MTRPFLWWLQEAAAFLTCAAIGVGPFIIIAWSVK